MASRRGRSIAPGTKPSPPRRTRAPRGEGDRLRREILKATEKLLIKAGDADAVPIRAIAGAVGVTPPSIYLHFADKEQLILAVCQEQFTRLEAAIDKAIAGLDDPLDRLRAMGVTYIGFGVRHPEQYRILLMGKGEFSPSDFESGVMPGMTTFLKLIAAVEDCMEAGVFRTADSFLVATGIWAVVHGITSMRITIKGFPHVGDRALVDHVLDTYARGLAP